MNRETPSTYRGGAREEQAWREVGHTDVRPATSWLLVAVFVGAVFLAPVLSQMTGAPPGVEGVESAWAQLAGIPADVGVRLRGVEPGVVGAGPWVRTVEANRSVLARLEAFEDTLDRESRPGRDLRPPAQRVLSGWFGAGNERVYIGRDGWTFYRPDVESLTGPPLLDPRQLDRRVRAASEWETPPQPDPRPAIVEFHRALAERGITLVVVPTPVKPTVHPDRLARAYGASTVPVQNPSYRELFDDVRREGVVVFDPAEMLVAERVRTGRPQYFATDTHWRPEAMEAVARELAAMVKAQVALADRRDPGYRTQSREVRQLGDTAAMLDLPVGQSLYAPETAWIRRIVGRDGRPWRPDREADVLLLGDSFTNIFSLGTMGWGESAGLAEQLSYELRRPVDRIVQNDAGAHATRERLAQALREEPDRLNPVRVVIWQFAARELAFGDWRLLGSGLGAVVSSQIVTNRGQTPAP
ncbi:MAG: hypothetical protein KJ066_11570 [Acidobacteria bacterium]|nr:hypothetical protein [Acidobacteriota bacterium]